MPLLHDKRTERQWKSCDAAAKRPAASGLHQCAACTAIHGRWLATAGADGATMHAQASSVCIGTSYRRRRHWHKVQTQPSSNPRNRPISQDCSCTVQTTHVQKAATSVHLLHECQAQKQHPTVHLLVDTSPTRSTHADRVASAPPTCSYHTPGHQHAARAHHFVASIIWSYPHSVAPTTPRLATTAHLGPSGQVRSRQRQHPAPGWLDATASCPIHSRTAHSQLRPPEPVAHALRPWPGLQGHLPSSPRPSRAPKGRHGGHRSRGTAALLCGNSLHVGPLL
jgi:hypothetical protein